jgi:tetratricopeptide (TPR) repeat protein
MGRHDWYRNETWTPEVRAAFRQRFRRSREPLLKAQYLRIQAVYLARAGMYLPAIELLDELLAEYPVESQLASARSQRAQCLLALGRVAEVVDEYRMSLQAERDSPTFKTGAWLNFACLVAFHTMADLYDEASAVLDEFASSHSLIFPAQRFQYAAARAFLADAKSDREAAREFARSALESAAAEHSGFRHHPRFGLVGDLDNRLEHRLAALAGELPADAADRTRG